MAAASTTSPYESLYTTVSNPNPGFVICPTEQECLASAPSTILTSSDGGRAWTEHHAAAVNGGFGSIGCMTAQTCLAAGGNELLMTHDGGTTWFEPAYPGGQTDLVSCPSAQACMVVGSSGLTEFVRTTDDGGAKWGGASFENMTIQSLACVSSAVCLAVSQAPGSDTPQLEDTTDSGLEWQAAPTPGGYVIQSIACPASSECLAMASAAGSTSSVLLESSDVGASWQVGSSPVPLGGTLQCSSLTTCFVVSSPGNGAQKMALSKDGGQTWTVSEPASEISSAWCTAAGWCVAFGGVASSSQKAAFTTDGSGSWTQTAVLGSYTPQAVSCPSPSVCVAVTDSGSIHTGDGGVEWTAAPWPAPASTEFAAGASVYSVSCPSETNCVAVGGTTSGPTLLLVTSDGATTWTQVPVVGDQPTFVGVSCSTSGFCMALGSTIHGSIALVSEDDGGTWTSRAFPTGFSPASVRCPAGQSCLVSGTGNGTFRGSAELVTTSDGGATWSIPTLPSDLDFLGTVDCPSGTQCYALGSTDTSGSLGAVVSSTDGGLTWTEDTVPSVSYQLGPIICPDPVRCYVGTPTAGSFIATSDGRTWNTVDLTDPAQVACTSLTVCLVPDEYGLNWFGDHPPVAPTSLSLLVSGLGHDQATAQLEAHAASPRSSFESDLQVTGNVTFLEDGQPIEGCPPEPALLLYFPSQCDVDMTGQGTHQFTAEYAGDANTGPTSSGAVTFPIPTTVTISTSADPVGTWQPVTLTATVTAPGYFSGLLDGTVTFAQGSEPITGCVNVSIDAGGQGTCVTNFASTGAADIGAYYGGTPAYAESQQTGFVQEVSANANADGCPTGATQASSGTATYMVSASSDVGDMTCPGYLVANQSGGVSAFGSAKWHGDLASLHLAAPIVGIVATPDGGGYYLVASNGGVFTFGDAKFVGSAGRLRLTAPVIGMTLTADGRGYWLAAANGGIFNYGDATFHGSLGGRILSSPVTGITADPATGGYWLTASRGGVFSFDAPYYGCAVPYLGSHPIVGVYSQHQGAGYLLVDSGGAVFAFGRAGFYGSLPGLGVRVSTVTDLALSADGAGYYILNPPTGTRVFGDALYLGGIY